MGGNSLSIVRTFDRPVDEVYRAWTEPARLARWVGEVEKADIRVGGAYRFVNDDGEGGRFVHHGEYLELVPDRRVVMTFKAGQVEDSPFHGETIAIDLRPLDGGRTELTFTNRWDGEALDEDGIAATRDGWNAWFDLLEAALA